MLVINMEEPKTCVDCLCNCRIPSPDIVILCRNDFKKHTPFDDGCILKRQADKIDMNYMAEKEAEYVAFD